MLYWLFWSSYTLKISNESFKKLFNNNLEDMFKFELRLGILMGLLRKTRDGYELTEKGAYKYHFIVILIRHTDLLFF